MRSIFKNKGLTFLLLIGVVVSAYAAVTKFTDLQVRNLTVTGTTTAGTYACTNNSFTNETVTGTSTVGLVSASSVTVNTAQGLLFNGTAITVASTVPRSIGILAFDSSWVAYISTAAAVGSWVKIGGQ